MLQSRATCGSSSRQSRLPRQLLLPLHLEFTTQVHALLVPCVWRSHWLGTSPPVEGKLDVRLLNVRAPAEKRGAGDALGVITQQEVGDTGHVHSGTVSDGLDPRRRSRRKHRTHAALDGLSADWHWATLRLLLGHGLAGLASRSGVHRRALHPGRVHWRTLHTSGIHWRALGSVGVHRRALGPSGVHGRALGAGRVPVVWGVGVHGLYN